MTMKIEIKLFYAGYGGPHAGFFACKQKYVRLIPGKVSHLK